MTFAYVFDAGLFRVRKYESVVIGLGTRVEVVNEEQKASLLDSRPCCWLMINSTHTKAHTHKHTCIISTRENWRQTGTGA